MTAHIDYLRFRRSKPSHATPEDLVDIFWDEESGGFVSQDGDGEQSSLGGAASVDNASVVTAIAEDPAASREALADENGNFPVQALVLEDTSTLALADGVIAWNLSLDSIVRHDGETIGGIPLATVQEGLRFRGAVTIPAADVEAHATDTVSGARLISVIPVIASQAVAGNKMRVIGRIWGKWSSAAESASIAMVSPNEITDGFFPPQVGVYLAFPSGNVISMDIDMRIQFDADTGHLNVVPETGTQPAGVTQFSSGGSPLVSAVDSAGTLGELVPSISQSMGLYVIAGEFGIGGTALRLNYDLTVIVDTP